MDVHDLPEPATLDRHDHLPGPFFHGTGALLAAGDELVAGRVSNYHQGRVMNHVLFTSLLETAAWGAQLATTLADRADSGHIYVVEPTGPFEDDPNVTDKKFPGNPTRSYRTRHALRVVSEVDVWEAHSPEAVDTMVATLARLRDEGLDVIED